MLTYEITYSISKTYKDKKCKHASYIEIANTH